MTSPPPEAAGPDGRAATAAPSAAEEQPLRPEVPPAAYNRPAGSRRGGGTQSQRPFPPVRPSDAPVELTLDLRGTPPDKVIARLLGALERVGDDVTLFVLLRDTPEYVGVTSSTYQVLRANGYVSDSSRLPAGGGQRLRVHRRNHPFRPAPRLETSAEPDYVPPPEPSPDIEDAEDVQPENRLIRPTDHSNAL